MTPRLTYPVCGGVGVINPGDGIRSCRNCSATGYVRLSAVPDAMTGPDRPSIGTTGTP